MGRMLFRIWNYLVIIITMLIFFISEVLPDTPENKTFIGFLQIGVVAGIVAAYAIIFKFFRK